MSSRRLCRLEVDDHIDVSILGVTEVTAAVRAVRRARARLDALETALAQRADVLAGEGDGVGGVETLVRSGGRSGTQARRVERRATTVAAAPSFADALADAEITAGHVDALANAAGRLRVAERRQFLAGHHRLVGRAKASTVEAFAAHARAAADRLAADGGEHRAQRQRRHTRLRRWVDARTGMYRITGEFDPVAGHSLFAAVDAEVAARAGADDDEVDHQALAARALVDLVGGGHQRQRPTKAQVTVVIDYDRLVADLAGAGVCELGDGETIPASVARRLACDAEILPVVLGGDSVPLDLGRARRLASPAQRAALRAVHRTCAFDGCDIAFDRCEIHHLDDWATHRGRTDLHRLVPLCSRHHHHAHQHRWQLDQAPDRTLTIQHPRGLTLTHAKPDRRSAVAAS